jgi:hypothetical protein
MRDQSGKKVPTQDRMTERISPMSCQLLINGLIGQVDPSTQVSGNPTYQALTKFLRNNEVGCDMQRNPNGGISVFRFAIKSNCQKRQRGSGAKNKGGAFTTVPQDLGSASPERISLAAISEARPTRECLKVSNDAIVKNANEQSRKMFSRMAPESEK